MEFVNLYDWPLRKEEMKREGVALPTASMNMQLFHNVVDYFR
jgi:phosphoribosylformylglycinamidine synthase